MSKLDYEQLTLFPEDSHASRLVLPGSEEARKMRAIEKAPIVEVVHGSWESGDSANPQMPTCSVCKNRGTFRTKYCPNCGADMRERKDDA